MANKDIKKFIPYNIQFFAEDLGGSEEGASGSDDNGGAENNEPTVESLMAELATLKADFSKNKVALDKALKEKGDLTKELRSKQTAAEQEAEARKEQQEQEAAYVKGLEEYKAKNEAVKRYLIQGMDNETSEKAAEAEISGDMDGLSDIQRKFREQSIKAAKAEWMKTRPEQNYGTGTNTMTREEIMAIPDRAERIKAIAMNPKAFE